MKKLWNMSRKWAIVIISAALLITLLFVSVSTIWRGKDKLFFIEEGKDNYCYTTHDMKSSDLSKYDNITKIAESGLDRVIDSVDIQYYRGQDHETKEEKWIPIDTITRGISSYVAWENNGTPQKVSMYLAANIDGKNADELRQKFFDIAFQVKENTLQISIKPRLEYMEFFSFNASAVGEGKSLELYFYTLITD